MASRLPRTKGRLKAVSETLLGGRKAFVCECDCGGRRTVLAVSFDRSSVTCCEECVNAKKRPNLNAHNPIRQNVSLDADTFAAFGIDLDNVRNRTGIVVRDLLGEFAWLLRNADEPPVTEDQWQRLKEVAVTQPYLLDRAGVPPPSTLAHLTEQAGVSLPVLGPVQVLAVLVALRWARDHPDDDGNWWEVTHRMGAVG